jgi:hypothetical protein
MMRVNLMQANGVSTMIDDRTDDDDDDDAMQVLRALTKIVSRLNAMHPDQHLQATLVRAQRIIERYEREAISNLFASNDEEKQSTNVLQRFFGGAPS